jgi:hypothetical protein
LQAAFEFARDTIKHLLLINGGAAAALLAFYGGNSDSGLFSRGAFFGLLWFALGVAAAVAASVSAYFAQLQYGTTNASSTTGDWALRVGFVLALVSLVLFVTGVLVTGCTLRSVP